VVDTLKWRVISGQTDCVWNVLSAPKSDTGCVFLRRPLWAKSGHQLTVYICVWSVSCRDKAIGACCRGMTDDSHRHKDVDVVISLLKAVYCRDGADMAVQAAKHMIAAAAALLTCEHGPEETRRILRIVGEAQGKAS